MLGVRLDLIAVLAVALTCLPGHLVKCSGSVDDTDPNLIQAAATPGADPVKQFLVMRPPLLPSGIVTGALVLFVLTTIDNQTLPVFVYSGLRGAISPALGAVSAFFIAVVALAFAAVLRLGKVERFLFRS